MYRDIADIDRDSRKSHDIGGCNLMGLGEKTASRLHRTYRETPGVNEIHDRVIGCNWLITS